MRRQFGADAVDIDTRASTCRLAFAEPELLDFAMAESAAIDAGYQMTGLTIETKGTVVAGPCAKCGTEVHYLELPGTGQRFELTEAQPLGPIELKATLEGWETFHPRLVVE